jgi:uncharacterized membrane protein YgcG
MPARPGHRLAGLACVSLAFAATASAARSLSWNELSVRARLDAQGVLHVEEKQAIVFDGDWNGGERRFRLGVGQELQFDGMDRLDAETGERVPLTAGSIGFVDHYEWHDASTLRWRSRDMDDPPFQNQQIVYVLRYRVSGVVEPALQGYDLDHDFAFPDRDGVIRRFVLDLEVDPVWRAEDPAALHAVVLNLPPGQGHVVKLDLRYLGSGRPAGVDAWPGRIGLLTRAALVGLPLLSLWHFFRSESRNGRFAPLPVAEVDDTWLAQNVLSQPPEVVGAAWDESVGAPEVAAVLARMVGEGKLESRVLAPGNQGKPELELGLCVNREMLPDHERSLVEKLFFAGDTTSTAKVKEHYKKTGFNPSAAIGSHVTKAAEAYVQRRDDPAPRSPRGGGWLFLAGIALIALGRPSRIQVPYLMIGAFVAVFATAIGFVASQAWKERLHWGRRHTALFLLPGSVPLLAAAVILGFPEAAGRLGLLHTGVVAIAACFFMAIVNLARSARGPRATAFRKRLAAARERFRRELKKRAPALKDEWFPYLVAFGLERDADRWFGAFGAADSGAGAASITRNAPTSSHGGSSATWTGGGGAFGGAGASGAWAAAATGLASGVASPGSSSSSGGGGGGGGGGRSGGGGGGGW